MAVSGALDGDPEPVLVRLLGPVDVVVGDDVLPVSGLRRKAVVSALALRAGGVVDADRLIDAVWDGRPPATATNTLQSHMSYLRRLLGVPGAIVARPPGYVLTLDAVATDVRMAESLIERGTGETDPAARASTLKAALELWRGRPLEDVAGLSWFKEQAARLERLRHGAGRGLAEARLALGKHLELVPELESLVEPYPYDEDLHGLLMVALYRGGRQTDALAVYHRLRDRLLDELGIDPRLPLRELETAILRQDPSLDLPAPGPVVVSEPRGAGSGPPETRRSESGSSETRRAESGLPAPALVERAAETRLIGQILNAAAAKRQGGFLLVEGPAGIGKTSLLDHARTRAEKLGFTVAGARGTDLEVDYAWGCVRQLFEPFARDPAAPAPAILRPASADPAAPQGEYSIINSLFWLAHDLASRNPLLIVVDDLHWIDASSAQFLAYLAARLDGLPAVVVAGLRPGSERVAHIASVIAGLPPAVTATLPPLTPGGCAELLAGLIAAPPDEELIRRCYDSTRGNPFLVRELGRQLNAPEGHEPALLQGSPNIERFVAGQLRHLPAHATSVAHALAVLGDGVGAHALGTVAGLSSREALDAVSSLVVNGLVTSRGVPARFSFGHSLIQSAVYAGIRASRLVDLHLRAVDTAMAGHDPIRAATHLLRIPPGVGDHDPTAILGEAIDVSLARGSVDGAVAFLRRQLDEARTDQRLDVLTRLGMAEALVNMPQAIESLSEVLTLEPDPERRAEIAFILACTTWTIGRPRQAALACQATLDRERRLSVTARRALQSCIGMVAYGTPHGTDLVALLDEFGAQEPDSSSGGLMLECSLALHDAMRNRRASAERRALRAITGDRLTGQPQAFPLMTCAWYALTPCDNPRLLSSIEEVLEHSRRAGSLRGTAPAFTYRSMVMHARGDLGEAVHDGRLAVEAAKNSGLDLGLVFVGNSLISALLARGGIEEAQSILNQVKAAHGPELNRYIYVNGEIDLLIARGHTQRALELTQAAREHCHTMGITNPEILDWRTPLVRCLLLRGRHEEAHAVAQDLLTAAAEWGTSRAVGRALRSAAGTVAGPRRLEMLTESVRLLEATDARLEHATSLYELGEALRRSGHLPEACSQLKAALELADLCGARPLRRTVLAAQAEIGSS
ncbi:BTAD domain-containing putative transcriptional regulator [Streptosporangium sp. NBC_01469]|uniref:BTAD domain-containing putative transcriptional regulator n=1 Tax=Streptosporangium sp. NBC_01469 TaxID=2903898 RepID=UPI002E2884FD|nr:BTAD domain-containing putative transcriptional regulator [Streptosporangium sp. NBC_01469]